MIRVASRALNKSYGKEGRKRFIFRQLRKAGRDDADVTWRGRSFQVWAAAIGKARLPTVDSRVRRTSSNVVSADRVLRHGQSYRRAAMYFRDRNI